MTTSWILVPSLVRLRSEFNAIAPNRDRSSDGSVGNAAHQQTNSDHNPDETSDALRDHDADSKNEVHAIDVDRDLKQPGLTMEDVVQHLLAECRAGREKRFKYIIFNRRIWSASRDWKQAKYTGPNPHDHHAHFSASYVTARESDTSDYGLEEEFMAIDYDKIRTIIREEVAKAVKTVDVPTPAENASATFTAFRNAAAPGMSDTGANLLVSQITAAVAAGKTVQPYPANKGKSLGELK